MKKPSIFRKARKKIGISGRELARRLGVSNTHLNLIELGENLPSEKLLKELCKELELDFDEVCQQLGKIPLDVQRYISRNPKVLKKLRKEMAA